MTNIKRSKLPNVDMFELELEAFDEELEDVGVIVNNPESLGSWIPQAINAGPMALVLGCDKKRIVRYFRLVADFVRSQFELAMKPEITIELSIDGENYFVKRNKQTAYLDYDIWLSGVYASMIIRDEKSIQSLMRVDIDLMRNADIKGSEFDYSFVEFIKGIFDDNKNIGDLMVSSMDKSDIEFLPVRKHDYVLLLKVPELMLYRWIFSSDPDGFNRGLVDAIEKHHSFWNQKKFFLKAEGWISYPILAACALAYDSRDIPIQTNSDYVPIWLAKGDF